MLLGSSLVNWILCVIFSIHFIPYILCINIQHIPETKICSKSMYYLHIWWYEMKQQLSSTTTTKRIAFVSWIDLRRTSYRQKHNQNTIAQHLKQTKQNDLYGMRVSQIQFSVDKLVWTVTLDRWKEQRNVSSQIV